MWPKKGVKEAIFIYEELEIELVSVWFYALVQLSLIQFINRMEGCLLPKSGECRIHSSSGLKITPNKTVSLL